MATNTLRPINGHPEILGCDLFFSELNKLFRKDQKSEKQYLKWIDRQFVFLTTMGLQPLLQNKTVEKVSSIKEDLDLYSLRRPESTGNPRLLFSLIEDEDGDVYIFLLAFKELHNDYHRYIPIAVERMKKLLPLITGEENDEN